MEIKKDRKKEFTKIGQLKDRKIFTKRFIMVKYVMTDGEKEEQLKIYLRGRDKERIDQQKKVK